MPPEALILVEIKFRCASNIQKGESIMPERAAIYFAVNQCKLSASALLIPKGQPDPSLVQQFMLSLI
jgi:hypothetical protein